MKFYWILVWMCCQSTQASDLHFKEEVALKPAIWNSLLLLIALGLCLYFWFKRNSKIIQSVGELEMIEKKRLSATTCSYVIKHRQQELIIIDNGQHIAIQPLKPL